MRIALKTVVLLSLEAPRRPHWFLDRTRDYVSRLLLNRFHLSRVPEYGRHLRPAHEALAYVTGRSETEFRTAIGKDRLQQMREERSGERSDPGPIPFRYDASMELEEIVYTLCKLLQPATIVETGVARGVTTAAILTALDENEKGQLYSVELPMLSRGYAKHIGEAVPRHLRRRWTLEIGPSRSLLPPLLRKLGSIDMFVHDSAHSYHPQKMEYEVALDYMASGAVLVSDDVANDSFIEVAEAWDCVWSIIPQSKGDPIGVLSKGPLNHSLAEDKPGVCK